MSYPRVKKTITDLPAYMRAKNKERREKARRTGICLSCNDDPVEPGFVKCPTCRSIHNAQRRAA